MKVIYTAKNEEILVDDEDFEELNKRVWMIHTKRGYVAGYYIGDKYEDRKKKMMHRIIMNAPDHLEVDHINGVKTDNRRCNLRLCDKSQNGANKPPMRNNKTGFKGVSFDKRENKYRAAIKFQGKKYQKNFKSAVEAARQYNKWAREFFGEFAYLNRV